MTGTDEQLGPALELLLRLARRRQNQSIDATAILMNPVNNLRNRARFGVDVKGAEQPPVTTCNRRSDYGFKVFGQMRRQPDISGHHRWIRPEHARNWGF